MSFSTTNNKPTEILLVEDNPGDVLLTKEAFKTTHLKYNLRVAKDGEEALHILKKQGKYNNFPLPDLILLDLNLPKVSGKEVLENIKGSQELKHIPVIILSGSEAESDMTSSFDLHANSYIVKPNNFNDLKEIITSIESHWLQASNITPTDKTLH